MIWISCRVYPTWREVPEQLTKNYASTMPKLTSHPFTQWQRSFILPAVLNIGKMKDGASTQRGPKAVRDVWKSHYKPQQSPNPAPSTLSSSSGNINQALTRLHKSRTPMVINRDELEAFARAGLDFVMPLPWWKLHHASWPALARMARDHYGIMATSTPSEQAFSQAHALLRYQRNRLGADRIRQNMCLKSWYTHFDLKK